MMGCEYYSIRKVAYEKLQPLPDRFVAKCLGPQPGKRAPSKLGYKIPVSNKPRRVPPMQENRPQTCLLSSAVLAAGRWIAVMQSIRIGRL